MSLIPFINTFIGSKNYNGFIVQMGIGIRKWLDCNSIISCHLIILLQRLNND